VLLGQAVAVKRNRREPSLIVRSNGRSD
jgi:hypothetical protein